MKVIESYKDIIKLRKEGYDKNILKVIEDKIKELYINITGDETLIELKELNLDEVGLMVLMEDIEDKINIEEILVEELIATYPEYINKIKLKDNKVIYEASILCNNEYGIQIFIPNKIVMEDQEIQNWIDENK
ncbi:MAG: hypothetical protein N2Z71_00795 [Caloramator sp.]|nr:hypothetical protein [Caloramator sp.]